jgi:hypothetical protein
MEKLIVRAVGDQNPGADGLEPRSHEATAAQPAIEADVLQLRDVV